MVLEVCCDKKNSQGRKFFQPMYHKIISRGFKIPYARNYYPRFLLFFHFIMYRLFFDDWRHSFEMGRLLIKSGYCQRAVNNCESTVPSSKSELPTIVCNRAKPRFKKKIKVFMTIHDVLFMTVHEVPFVVMDF